MGRNLSRNRISRRIFPRIWSIFTFAGMLFALTSCREPAPYTAPILKKGDDLNGMVVTTGISNAPPLEAFCNLEMDEEATTIDCQVPPLPKLAIGQMISGTGRALQELDWSKLDWQIYLDGYRLDLDSFGVKSYIVPELISASSPIREVFKQWKTWDVVLINPTFGLHTLLCTASSESVVYNWVVNFTIDSTRGPEYMVDHLPRQTSAGQDARDDSERRDRLQWVSSSQNQFIP